jgi:hypothetical protein
VTRFTPSISLAIPIRQAVAAGTASVCSVGAGRFDRQLAATFADGVEVAEL